MHSTTFSADTYYNYSNDRIMKHKCPEKSVPAAAAAAAERACVCVFIRARQSRVRARTSHAQLSRDACAHARL